MSDDIKKTEAPEEVAADELSEDEMDEAAGGIIIINGKPTIRGVRPPTDLQSHLKGGKLGGISIPPPSP